MITLFKDPFFTGFDTNRFLSTPETNISKSETEYSVSISVPGLTKDDLKISTKEGILKIIYERILFIIYILYIIPSLNTT